MRSVSKIPRNIFTLKIKSQSKIRKHKNQKLTSNTAKVKTCVEDCSPSFPVSKMRKAILATSFCLVTLHHHKCRFAILRGNSFHTHEGQRDSQSSQGLHGSRCAFSMVHA